MTTSRRADFVNFGFDFQRNAAIVLMLENISELSSLRSEGNFEDIDICLNNKEHILAQAKSVVNSSNDFSHVRANLEKALRSLSDGALKCRKVNQLIFITNSPNPLNDDSKYLFIPYGQRPFDSLPEPSQALINSYLDKIDHPLDKSKFKIQVFQFETDIEPERYKYVKSAIGEFLEELKLNNSGLGKQILYTWQNDIFINGTKRDATIELSKSDLICPIMVIVTDVQRIDEELKDEIDASLYDEVIDRYKDLIEECCDKCEFFIKVISDYNSFKNIGRPSEKLVDFVKSKWQDYKLDFPLQYEDEEMQRALIQVILFNIIKNKRSIERIKKGVNL